MLTRSKPNDALPSIKDLVNCHPQRRLIHQSHLPSLPPSSTSPSHPPDSCHRSLTSIHSPAPPEFILTTGDTSGLRESTSEPSALRNHSSLPFQPRPRLWKAGAGAILRFLHWIRLRLVWRLRLLPSLRLLFPPRGLPFLSQPSSVIRQIRLHLLGWKSCPPKGWFQTPTRE